MKSLLALGLVPFLGVVLGFSSTQASAGDLLRLKAGVFSPEDQSSRITDQALSRSGEMTAEKTAFVVQFSHRIGGADRQSLNAAGLQIQRYLPDDALLVVGSARQAALAHSNLRSSHLLTELQPEWKLDRALLTTRQAKLVLIQTLDNASAQTLLREIPNISGATLFQAQTGGSRVAAHLSPAAILAVAALPSVEWMEEMTFYEPYIMPAAPSNRADGLRVPPPAYTGYETGTKLMNFDAAWARGYKGDGQIVAMADTGVDSGDVTTLHKDFSNFQKGFPYGFFSSSWADEMGHGTHVAGSILGSGAASADGSLHGGAFHAKLVIESIWSPFMNGIVFGSDMPTMLGSAYDEGARVHSNSWGAASNAYDQMAADVDDFMWKHPDFLLVFAAGNGGVDKNSDGVIDSGSLGSPGTAKNVLTVGASENLFPDGGQMKSLKEWHPESWPVEPLASDHVANNPDGLAAFSSRGPTSDGRTKPEIVSPGTNIVSARSHQPKAELLWGEYDSEHLYCGGTSMATPLTSGAAAVVRQFLIQGRGIASPSAAIVKATMMHTAHDLFPGQYGLGATQEIPVRRPNIQEGYGRVDMDAATALGLESRVIDDTAGVGLGEEHLETVTIGENGGTLRATLSYTDAPAAAAAAVALVNDLDLQVVGPTGIVYELGDHKNNSEMLELSALVKGTYQVKVKGVNVPQGKNNRQPYALLITAK